MKDVNGRRVRPTGWRAMVGRWRGGDTADGELSVDDPAAVVVAQSADPAVASSAVLESGPWEPARQVIVRHILRIPANRADEAVATAALDEYLRLEVPATAVDGLLEDAALQVFGTPGESGTGEPVTVVLGRVQLLDAMHLSQERSRMASLGARHGGVALAWQVLQTRS